MFKKRSRKAPPPPPAEDGRPHRRTHTVRRIALVFTILVATVVAGLGIYGWYWSNPMRVAQNSSRGTSVWPIALLACATALVLCLLWKIPIWQVDQSEGVESENRFDRENEARKTIAQVLGGSFLIFGFYSSMRTLDLTREGQITDRFSKAVDQLSAIDTAKQPNYVIRLGGIYALERIARDSERDDPVIMQILAAYVRDQRPLPPKEATNQRHPITPDVRAALAVLGRRDVRLDDGAPDLSYSDLREVDFRVWQLQGADLGGSDLRGDSFVFTNMRSVSLMHANLQGANFSGAFLQEANIEWADARGADFRDAHIEGSHVHGTDFTKARFDGQYEIDKTMGDNATSLPMGLTTPSNWSKTPLLPND